MRGLIKKYHQLTARTGILCTLVATAALPLAAQADLLNNSLSFPKISFNNDGTTNYRYSDGAFIVDASPTSFRLSAASSPVNITGNTIVGNIPAQYSPGVRDFIINIILDDAGNLVSGGEGPDLFVSGAIDGEPAPVEPLLTGEIIAFGFKEQGATDKFDFTFGVTGGELITIYPQTVTVTLNSESSTFTGSFATDFSGEAKGTLGAASCALSVEKTCAVLTPVSSDYQCTKPINELTMIWAGQDNVTLRAYKGDTNSELLGEFTGVDNGEEVTVNGYVGAPNDVTWVIFDESGNEVGESIFHLSCSDDAMDGPEDCGMPQGDGKDDKDGFLNDWLLEGIVDAGGVLNCTADELPGAKQCEVPNKEGELCSKRPTEISFLFHAGDDCGASDNTQDNDKWSCSDSGVTNAPVQIIVSKPDGKKVALDTGPGATVNDGDIVTATAANAGEDDFESESRIQVLDGSGGLLQDIILHTSCSQDLAIGDRFGALEVVGFVNEEQGTVQSGAEVKYTYVVSNTGSDDLTDITVEDDGLDPTTVPGSGFNLLAGQVTDPALMAPVFVTDPVTGIVTVTGIAPNGKTCSASDSTTVTVADPTPCVVSPGEFKLEDDKIKWKLTNDGDKVATIESIELSAPDEFGAVKKVKLDGDIFKDATRPMTWTFTDADFINDPENRQIKMGDTKTLEFETTDKFKDASADDISITVNFREGCSITFVPGAEPFVCSDAKPIDELSMIWNDDSTVDVSVAGQEALGVTKGQTVTFDGLSGMGNNVVWDISGDVEGITTFHVSCSDSAMNGPEDCFTPQGDGKDDKPEDGMNYWLFNGMSGTNGIGFDCSAP